MAKYHQDSSELKNYCQTTTAGGSDVRITSKIFQPLSNFGFTDADGEKYAMYNTGIWGGIWGNVQSGVSKYKQNGTVIPLAKKGTTPLRSTNSPYTSFPLSENTTIEWNDGILINGTRVTKASHIIFELMSGGGGGAGSVGIDTYRGGSGNTNMPMAAGGGGAGGNMLSIIVDMSKVGKKLMLTTSLSATNCGAPGASASYPLSDDYVSGYNVSHRYLMTGNNGTRGRDIALVDYALYNSDDFYDVITSPLVDVTGGYGGKAGALSLKHKNSNPLDFFNLDSAVRQGEGGDGGTTDSYYIGLPSGSYGIIKWAPGGKGGNGCTAYLNYFAADTFDTAGMTHGSATAYNMPMAPNNYTTATVNSAVYDSASQTQPTTNTYSSSGSYNYSAATDNRTVTIYGGMSGPSCYAVSDGNGRGSSNTTDPSPATGGQGGYCQHVNSFTSSGPYYYGSNGRSGGYAFAYAFYEVIT